MNNVNIANNIDIYLFSYSKMFSLPIGILVNAIENIRFRIGQAYHVQQPLI